MASLARLYIQIIMPDMQHAVSSVPVEGTIIIMPDMQHAVSSVSAVGTSIIMPDMQHAVSSVSAVGTIIVMQHAVSSVSAVGTIIIMQHAVSGVSVEGTIITTRDQANQGFYGRALTGKQLLLGGAVSPPTAAKALYAALHDLMDRVEEPVSVAASTR